MVRALRRNPSFIFGLVLIVGLIAFAVIGRVFAGWNDAFPLSAPPSMPPDGEWIFGTDADGRDLFAVIVYGTLLTLKIGVIAGCLGLGIGTTLAFIAAYHGGWLDAVMRVAVDVLLTIPTLLVLVVIASVIHRSVNTTTIGIIIALLAWREPARQIRSQVLVMREAQYVKLAILNGASAVRIIFLEMMPNLLPFLGANLVVAISQAVLASIGLEALGLGSPSEPTLGQTIYWMMNESAFMLGLWWWIIEPIAILIILFVSLVLLTASLDEIANPRLRRAEA
ncbi:MAG TPA: ABC transporter permease [Acetobacteraceae bacterium]|nr:ABC transporter permease [Acetobacteraceae bacterium]